MISRLLFSIARHGFCATISTLVDEWHTARARTQKRKHGTGYVFVRRHGRGCQRGESGSVDERARKRTGRKKAEVCVCKEIRGDGDGETLKRERGKGKRVGCWRKVVQRDACGAVELGEALDLERKGCEEGKKGAVREVSARKSGIAEKKTKRTEGERAGSHGRRAGKRDVRSSPRRRCRGDGARVDMGDTNQSLEPQPHCRKSVQRPHTSILTPNSQTPTTPDQETSKIDTNESLAPSPRKPRRHSPDTPTQSPTSTSHSTSLRESKTHQSYHPHRYTPQTLASKPLKASSLSPIPRPRHPTSQPRAQHPRPENSLMTTSPPPSEPPINNPTSSLGSPFKQPSLSAQESERFVFGPGSAVLGSAI